MYHLPPIQSANIRQYSIGNCALLAPLITIAERYPDLTSQLVKVNKHGLIEVTYFTGASEVTLILDSTKIIQDNRYNSHTNIKVFLLEKAYALFTIIIAQLPEYLNFDASLKLKNGELFNKEKIALPVKIELKSYNLSLETAQMTAYRTLLNNNSRMLYQPLKNFIYSLREIQLIILAFLDPSTSDIVRIKLFNRFLPYCTHIFGNIENANQIRNAIDFQTFEKLFENLENNQNNYVAVDALLNHFLDHVKLENQLAHSIKSIILHAMFTKRLPTSSQPIEKLFEQIASSLQAGHLVSIYTKQSIGIATTPTGINVPLQKGKGLVGGHAYAVVNVIKRDETYYLILCNPWSNRYGRKYNEKIVEVNNNKQLKLQVRPDENTMTSLLKYIPSFFVSPTYYRVGDI